MSKNTFKYLVGTVEDPESPNINPLVTWKLSEHYPGNEMDDKEIERWIINVAAIKIRVDNQLSVINKDDVEGYSTFEVARALNVNKNTLQSALAGLYIVPDLHKAAGKSERSRFSREGIYRVSLFFHLVRRGIPRRKAAKLIRDEFYISWKNVGNQSGV